MSSVKLTGNFLATARCLIFSDGGGITWTFNPNTNTLQASGSGGGVTGLANPSVKAGPAVTNSSGATTAMYSDAAPAIDLTANYAWSGHTGWFGAAAIAQPTTAVGAATFVQVDVTSLVSQDSTFDGYTLKQVVKALRNLGLLA